MYRELNNTTTVTVDMANIINTYDVLKVQQQNVRSTKLVKGLKEIQRSIPSETFRESDVVLDIDPIVQSKINQVLMKYHMTMSKKYRVDNTYTIMCNCLTANNDIGAFKSATIMHNPDNNIQPTWEEYSKMGIDYNVKNEICRNFIDATNDTILPVEEMRFGKEDDFDSIPSATSMKNVADAINKDIIELRKEIAYGIRFAAKCGEYEFSTRKVVYGCIISELKSKGYNVRVFDGVTTFSFK